MSTLSAGCSKSWPRASPGRPWELAPSTARLIDAEMAVDFAAETTPRDVVTLVATRPLTRDEAWTPLPLGRLVAFRDGRRVRLPAVTGWRAVNARGCV